MAAELSSFHRHGDARTVVAVGIVALAVAMGIGRFAFTPLLPLMLRDGTIDAATGAEWAAANYAGYLVGALAAARMGRRLLPVLRMALVGVVVATMAVALVDAPVPGAALRFVAGIFSAWVLVTASSWCLAELARLRAVGLGAWIYTGIGIGIGVAGMLAWLGALQPARWLWLELGLLAAVGTAYVVGITSSGGNPRFVKAPNAAVGAAGGHADLVLCYGAFGFGYIVPATFLPTLAREQIDNALVFGLIWPLFGVAAVASVAIVARLLAAVPRRRVWAVAQATMAVGTGLPAVAQAIWALAASAVLVGGTSMVATMAGLQLARERVPAEPTPLLARMTAAFATGQVAGPVIVRLLSAQGLGGQSAMTLASGAAALLLALTSIWLWREDPRGRVISNAGTCESCPRSRVPGEGDDGPGTT